MMGSGGLSNLMPMIDNLLKLYIIFNHSQRRPFIIDAKFNYVLHAEQPNNDLTSFHGYIARYHQHRKMTFVTRYTTQKLKVVSYLTFHADFKNLKILCVGVCFDRK